jgi:archaemetzincin
VSALYLVAVGNVPDKVWEWITNAAAEWFPLPIRHLGGLSIPAGAFDPKRNQYQSIEIMRMLTENAPPDAARILGVTGADLCIPMLSFLFGQAQLDGKVAVVSLCRLQQEFYGLAAQDDVLRERLTKEVLHEMGHTFGLVHCSEHKCAMSLSTHIGMVDIKSERYCDRCGLQLAQRVASLEEYEKKLANPRR